MSNINKFLANILAARYGKDVRQSIHDAIKEIDAVADTAQDSATKMANQASNHETVARQCMESALASAESARISAEQAMSGTPEGYSALVEQVGLLDIAKSTGNTLYNSKKGGYRLNDLVGNTVQNGEPTPSTPIAIENTFDCVEMEQGSIFSSNGTIADGATRIRSKRYIPCKGGDKVTVILNKSVDWVSIFCYDDNNNYIQEKECSVDVSTNSYNGKLPSSAKKFKFVIGTTNAITPQTVGKITLTVNGKYVGQIVELGRNELEYVDRTSGYLDSTGAVISDSTWFHKIVEVDSNYDYLINGTNSGSSPKICWFDSNMKFISYLNIANGLFTPPSNAKYFGVSFVGSNKNITVQIQKVTTFYLTEPLRATDRIVKVDGVWYEERNVKEQKLSELDYYKLSASTDELLKLGCSKITNRNASAKFKPLCNVFTVMQHDTVMNGTIVAIGFNSGNSEYMYLNIPTSLLTENTPSGFKTWCTENDAYIVYPLATPTLTPLDTDSQLALNDMVTFDGVTYIEVDSKVKPTSISGEHGTSQVGAYTLKCMNDNDTDRVERAELKAKLDELAVALVSQ